MDECEAGGLSRGQGKWRHFPPWPCTFAPRRTSRARRICPRQYHAPALRWENARGRGATRLRRPGPHSPPQRHRPALPAAHCAGHRSSPKNSPPRLRCSFHRRGGREILCRPPRGCAARPLRTRRQRSRGRAAVAARFGLSLQPRQTRAVVSP